MTAFPLAQIADYYSAKLSQHGETPKGVDWNGEKCQTLRFEQLVKVIAGPGEFLINDLGCGYGAFFDFLKSRHEHCRYFGYDISIAMLNAARRRHANEPSVSYQLSSSPDQAADYTVASGIFNVRLGQTDKAWLKYIHDTLDAMDASSTRGFAFNCLTSYSDSDRMRPDLFYSDPCAMFDFCKRRYSSNVALLHDYQLYEYTLIVRK